MQSNVIVVKLYYLEFFFLRNVDQFVIGIIFQHLKEETKKINNTNLIICTPGRLLQHMDETFNFNADNLQILGKGKELTWINIPYTYFLPSFILCKVEIACPLIKVFSRGFHISFKHNHIISEFCCPIRQG